MRTSNLTVLLLSAAGAALCLYEMQVLQSSKDGMYKPLCDISRTLSCSGVLRSPQAYPLSYFGLVKPGALYDISGAALGLLFYIWMSTFAAGRRTLRGVYLGAAAVSVINSLAWTYAAYTRLQVLCPIRWTTTMINVALFAMILATRPHKGRGRPIATDLKRKRG